MKNEMELNVKPKARLRRTQKGSREDGGRRSPAEGVMCTCVRVYEAQ